MFIEPVFGKKFFGREQVLATLHKRVTAMKGGYRQNVALTGPMLAGKSSILRHFLKSVKDSDVIPIYIELAGEDYNVFCMRYMATLMRSNRPAADVMDILTESKEASNTAFDNAKGEEPCPCGSQMVYKECHGWKRPGRKKRRRGHYQAQPRPPV